MSTHVLDHLSAYLDGELASAERSAVELHLRSCGECARHLDELRAVDEAARAIDVVAPPGYFDALPSRVRARLSAPRRRTPPVWVWAAAAAVVLAALTPLTVRRATSPLTDAAKTEEEAAARPAPEAPPVAAPTPAAEAPARPAEVPQADRLRAPRDKVEAVAPPAARNVAPELARGGRGREDERRSAAPRPAPAPPAQAQRHVGPYAQGPAPAQAQTQAQARAQGAARAEEAQEELAAESKLKKQAEAAPGGKSDRDAARADAVADRAHPASAGFAEPPGEERYRALKDRPATTVEAARKLRDDWDAFVRADPDGPRADEARVSAIEAAVRAFGLGRDPADRERARAAAQAYLARADALQLPRVRALLARLD